MATEDVSILHSVSEIDTYSSQYEYPNQDPIVTAETPITLTASDGNTVVSYAKTIVYSTIVANGNNNIYLNVTATDTPTSVTLGAQPQFPPLNTYHDQYGDVLDPPYQYYEYQTIETSSPTPNPTPAPTPTPTPTPTPAASPALTAQDVGAVNDIFDDYSSSEEAGRSTVQSIVHFIHQNLAALNQDASAVDSDPQTTALGDELAAEISSGHHINLEKFWKAAAQTVSGGALLTGAEAVGLAVGAPAGAATLIGAALITDGVLKVTDAVLGTHYEQKTINHLSSFFHAGHF